MNFRPHQDRCSVCTKLKDNCDKLDFEEMKPMRVQGGYAVLVTLVKCSKFELRDRNA